MQYRNTLILSLSMLMICALWSHAGQNPVQKRTPFPHATHIENELECTDCHEGAVDTDEAAVPDAETCYFCHEEPAEESETIAAFFKERDAGDGKLAFRSHFDFKDLTFSHKNHVDKGAECFDCHGDVVKGDFLLPGDPDFKHTCLDCHKLTEASVDCKVCHETYRKNLPPAGHGTASFKRKHGGHLSRHFNELPEDSCFFCHDLDGCRTCHKATRPDDHDYPMFLRHHGHESRADHLTLKETRCVMCHEQDGCNACHSRMEPRSHTVSFKNRTHGMTARMDRRSCTTCHIQTFCVQCHSTVTPISHAGQFGRGFQTHCFQCHLPLQENSCWTCHKSQPNHDSLPMPSDATHAGATPNSCRVCHTPVPHADNGMDCTLCH